MYRVKISRRSYFDIDQIYDYIAINLQNPYSADKIRNKILRRINSLNLFPNGYAKVIGKSCRVVHAAKYSIFYEVNDEDKTVEILRVLYSRRDLGGLI